VRLDRHGDPLPEGALLRLGTLRWRAVGEVETLAVSPDGTTVAAASREGVSLFGPDGRVTQQIRPRDPSNFVSLSLSASAFSPDGKRLACRGLLADKGQPGKPAVQILDLATTRKVQQFPVDGLVWQGWSAEGEPLAVSLVKGAVLFRELTAGKEHRFEMENLPDPRIGMLLCGYAAQVKLLAVRDQRSIIHVWDTSTGRKQKTLDTKSDYLFGLALSADGRTLAALVRDADDKRAVQVWDVPAGKITHTLAADQKSLAGVAFSPDGRTLATVSWSEVRFLDPVTGRERGRAQGVPSFGRNVAFSPDGKTLVTTEMHSGTLHHWDVPSGALRPAPPGHSNGPNRISFTPDGTRVATAGSMDGTVFVWDAKSSEPVTRFRGRGWVRSCAISADGRSIFVYRTGDTLEVADAATGRTLHTLKADDPDQPGTQQSGLDMHLSDDRKTLVALSTSYPREGEVYEGNLLLLGWDATTHKLLFRRRRSSVAFWPVVSSDTRMLAFAHGGEGKSPDAPGGHGPVHVEDLHTGQRLLDLPDVKGQTWPIAFSADGRLLATFTFGPVARVKPGLDLSDIPRTIRLWELASTQEILALPTTDNARMAFSADGRWLAATGPNRDILLRDLRQGGEVRRFQGFDSRVSSLAFSPDGLRLYSGLADSTLLVWDAAVGKAAKAAPPDAATLNRAWADLLGEAKNAFAARGALVQWPAETVGFLKERLKPIWSADAALLRQLIADLDNEAFAVREKARVRLEELGEQASEALTKALGGKPSLEARRRMEALLARWRGPIRDAETLRAVRAVAVLEDIGTAEARAVLKTLAGGLQAARQTQEARKALERASRGPK
jgi:WD40 repeat protein